MMPNANILNLEGKKSGSVELPAAFSETVRKDLIFRAIHAEKTEKIQPQGHYLLAGMQTTARYYGAMSSYRTGRHMGIAIRPREKLGGGAQGKVKRIPSAVKGKRAHPHKIEKVLTERINSKEYQKAIRSAIAATMNPDYARVKLDGNIQYPLIISRDVEKINKTKEIIILLKKLGLDGVIQNGKEKRKKKGLRRSAQQRKYRKTLLMILGENGAAAKAARNIAGADICTVENLSANQLAPGGLPGRLTIWSEDAIGKLDAAIKNMKL
jgi:large subunit ribosomal protein L4e